MHIMSKEALNYVFFVLQWISVLLWKCDISFASFFSFEWLVISNLGQLFINLPKISRKEIHDYTRLYISNGWYYLDLRQLPVGVKRIITQERHQCIGLLFSFDYLYVRISNFFLVCLTVTNMKLIVMLLF